MANLFFLLHWYSKTLGSSIIRLIRKSITFFIKMKLPQKFLYILMYMFLYFKLKLLRLYKRFSLKTKKSNSVSKQKSFNTKNTQIVFKNGFLHTKLELLPLEFFLQDFTYLKNKEICIRFHCK